MGRYVMRAWLDDRPGALGSLTSALGELGADVIAIDILERDGGRVVDEVTVDLTGLDAGALARAVDRLEHVQVEDVRSVVDRLAYPGTDPLELAVELGRQQSHETVAVTLANGVASVFSGEWAAVVTSGDDHDALAVAGQPPPVAWLAAFASGTSVPSPRAVPVLRGPRDVAWAPLEHAGATVVVGRGGPPFRAKERHQLFQLGRLADCRWHELVVRAGMNAHPSGGYGRHEHPAAAS